MLSVLCNFAELPLCLKLPMWQHLTMCIGHPLWAWHVARHINVFMITLTKRLHRLVRELRPEPLSKAEKQGNYRTTLPHPGNPWVFPKLKWQPIIICCVSRKKSILWSKRNGNLWDPKLSGSKSLTKGKFWVNVGEISQWGGLAELVRLAW